MELIVVGTALLVVGLIGKVEFRDIKIGATKNKIARYILGILGIIFVIFHFIQPKDLIDVMTDEKSVLNKYRTSLIVNSIKDNTPNQDADWLSMKTERNLVELFSNAGLPVFSASTIKDAKIDKKERYYKIEGNLYERGQDIIVEIRIENNEGKRVTSCELKCNRTFLEKHYKIIPEVLVYGLDIDPSTLKIKHTKKKPTNSLEAYSYWVAAKKLASKSKDLSSNEAIDVIKLLNKAVDIDRDFAMAYWSISCIYSEIGEADKAKMWDNIARKIDKDHPRCALFGSKTLGDPLINVLKLFRDAKSTIIEKGLTYKKIYSKDYRIKAAIFAIDTNMFSVNIKDQNSALGNSVKDFLKLPKAVLAINGGFFDIDREHRLTPSGLLVIENTLIKPISEAGSGVFVANNNHFDILSVNEVQNPTQYKYAIQCGPRLVDKKGKMGIYSNDYNRHNRSAVCIKGQKVILVIIVGDTGDGLSLYELARLLYLPSSDGGCECDVALNLDGGPSVQVALKTDKHQYAIDGLWRIQNSIVISRK
jgi:uncharacterized protein YigE (DUF2233 family)